MFGIGHAPEVIILLVIVLLVFGPGKLPEIGSAVGRGIRGFKDATSNRDERPTPVLPADAETPGLQQPGQQCATREDVREPIRAEADSDVPAEHVLAGR
jgi:sec-independent protein translocase protein TatA